MTIIYCDEFNDWGVERDENNILYYYFFDPAMGGGKCKIEIDEKELDFALKENPRRDEFAAYIAANRSSL